MPRLRRTPQRIHWRGEVREDLQQSTREKNVENGDRLMVEQRHVRTYEQQYAAAEMTKKQ